MTQTGWRLIAKKIVDRAAAATGIVVLSPVLGIAALAVAATSGRPILFKQQRAGRGGRAFTIYKLRTMRAGNRPDEERLTRAGRLLRALSVDELPQLWNLLRGEMSLVGPRPLLVSYLDRYSPEAARRHDVLPGITGWAQVNGRNAVCWEERLARDVWYVDHWSLWLDARILAATIVRVLRRDGVSKPGHATMPEFMG